MQFTYKFNSVKKVKEILEKKAQKEASEIQLEIDRKEDEFNLIFQQKIDESKKNIKAGSASELKFHKMYVASLDEELEKIKEEIERLKINKEKKVLELLQKSKEYKIFDKLEEIYHENFNQEQNRLELAGIDEMATQKFARKRN